MCIRDSRGGKLKMGPIWDLNIGYNRQDRVPFTDWIANYNQYVPRDAWMVPFWWKVFLGDDYFKQRLKERWTGIGIDYLQVSDALKNHLQDRLLWMDQKINSM